MVVVKYILKYFWRTRDYVLVYSGEDLTFIAFMDSDFQLDLDLKSQHLVLSSVLAELLFGVLNKVVFLTPPWKLNMWLLMRLLKK